MAAWSRKTEKFSIFCIFGKLTPYTDLLKIMFPNDSSWQRSTCCVQISWNLADEKSVKSCVFYLKTNFCMALQLSLLRGLHSECVRTSSGQFAQSAPDFIQIRSLSAELHPNAWTLSKRAVKCFHSNIRLKPSFEPIMRWRYRLHDVTAFLH